MCPNHYHQLMIPDCLAVVFLTFYPFCFLILCPYCSIKNSFCQYVVYVFLLNYMVKYFTMDIENWLKVQQVKLSKHNIATARLDAEIILAYVLEENRTFLHAHPGKILKKQTIFHANNL
ncbi:MAG: hypothetical protein KIG14_02640, partial [Candidatus Sacchiramonaceae bacterium]|nr:hypothetical protein [Candidatus Saccharimonadaceae bacterium]